MKTIGHFEAMVASTIPGSLGYAESPGGGRLEVAHTTFCTESSFCVRRTSSASLLRLWANASFFRRRHFKSEDKYYEHDFQ